MSDRNMKIQVMGIAWYNEADYPAVLAVMADRDKLPATWREWRQAAEKAEAELKAKGAVVVRAKIDPATFAGWCRERGLNVDAKARMRFGNEAAYAELLRRQS